MKPLLRNPMRWLAVGAVFAVSGALAVMSAAGPSQAAPVPVTQVAIGDRFYDPKDVTIKTGERVTWTNNGISLHTVTSTSGLFDSGTDLVTGATYSVDFPAAGTFPYYCQVHGSSMSGTVIVTEVVTPPPTPAPTPPPTAAPTDTPTPAPTDSPSPGPSESAAATQTSPATQAPASQGTSSSASASPTRTPSSVSESGDGGGGIPVLLIGVLFGAFGLVAVGYYAYRVLGHGD